MYQSIIQEYSDLILKQSQLEAEIHSLPKGYVSKKKIAGHSYYYLQQRVHQKLNGTYIPMNRVEEIVRQIKLRSEYKAELKSITEYLKKIEKTAARLDTGLLSYLRFVELSAGMDNLSVQQKGKSVSFADTMNAIEGVPANQDTKKDLQLWVNGQKAYLDVCRDVLQKYGVQLGDE